MRTSQTIARLVGPVLLAIGVGLLANRSVYQQMAAQFLTTPYIVYLTGVLAMVAGLAILNAHPDWTRDWRSTITLIGWFLTVIGVFRIFAPQLVNFVGTSATENAGFFTGAGIALLALGGLLTFKGYGVAADLSNRRQNNEQTRHIR
jgi:predicted Na+-dependent transporter